MIINLFQKTSYDKPDPGLREKLWQSIIQRAVAKIRRLKQERDGFEHERDVLREDMENWKKTASRLEQLVEQIRGTRTIG